MVTVSRLIAPLACACLFVTPATAQERAAATTIIENDLSSAEMAWHLRAALNVAALACRGPEGEEMVRLYNAMLDTEQRPLAEAAAATERGFKARFAGRWQDVEDKTMTRVYNHFASPPAHDAFCAAAHDVLRESVVVEPSDFVAFAAATLARLETPFVVRPAPALGTRFAQPVVIAALDRTDRPAPVTVAYVEMRQTSPALLEAAAQNVRPDNATEYEEDPR